MKVYFDNSATTKVDPRVVKEMEPYFTEIYGNPNSLHSWGQKARIAVDKAREKVANALGTEKASEIIFTSCATEANNLALKGVVEYANQTNKHFKNGKAKPHLIVSPIEHHCVLDTAKYLDKTGKAEISWLDVDKHGLVNPKQVESLIKKETVLVSVMFVNNEVGTTEPIKEISSAINKKQSTINNKIYFHTDAVQAIEYFNVDVQKLGVDMLSLSAHKFHGPKGIGALYIREGTKLVPQIHGGGQEYQLRAGTENVPYIAGLGKAIEIAEKERKKNRKKVKKLREKLISGVLEKIPSAKLTGHPEKRAPHIASFVFEGAEGEVMILLLDREGIASTSGSACTSGELEPSHVLLAMGVPQEVAHASLRLSLGKYNTEKEVDYVLEKLPPIINKLQEMSPESLKKDKKRDKAADGCFQMV
ncbi:MAG: aminotransferase class V-fold PLP-dependent enzyme [Patescibacteria group bacterium]|nr:aminotransferase class V-fold PLP-dependent enzyme [Patescibacteria group bacterium]